MRFALLCDDPTVTPWLDAFDGESPHELALACALTPASSDLLRGRSGIRLTNHWEELLGSREFDAILVGGSDQAILDAVKQLAATGQPLLFLPSADQGSTFIYELSLIRDDNKVQICPAFWHRCDPTLLDLRRRIHDGSLGRLRLVQLERVFQEVMQELLLSLGAVNRAQLFDLDLLRWIVGDYDQVTAVRTGATPTAVLTQSVKLAGRDLPESTWNASVGTVDSCRLTIHGERGRLQLELDPAGRAWRLIDPDEPSPMGNSRGAFRAFLDQFDECLLGKTSASRPAFPVEWPELVKAFETVDATQRSVTRRRTIELHFEPMSERAIFKTQMTAIGCGVLVGTFLLSLAYLAIASTIPLPPLLLFILRALVFAPLVIFLLLQILYPLTRPSQAESDTAVAIDDSPA